MLIYVAGPYSGKTHDEIGENIAAARAVAIALWEKGHAVICPHLNTAHFEVDCKCTYDDYMRGDFKIIARCDAIVMLNGWESSKGSCLEHAYAESLGIPIYYRTSHYFLDPSLPPLHPTEIQSPEQCKAFAETLGTMYRLHLSKNADYSPSNVLGPGSDGLMTRIWDKATRLMNLCGFKVYLRTNDTPKTLWQKLLYALQGRVVVIDEVIFTEPRVPKHESIDDTLLDNSVYSIIFRLFRAGKWGH